MNQNKGVWVWVVVIVVVILIVLGLWWVSANQSVNSATDMATSTSATSTSTGGPAVTDRSSDSVTAIVASLGNVSEFQSLFSSTGVGGSLSAGGKYTIFVPTDSAFSNVTKGTITSMTSAQLKRLVQYHVVAGREVQVGTQTLGVIQALSGDPLNFSDTNNIPTVNSAIVVAEYKGSNGIVYVINNVLIPPQKATE